MAKYRPEKQGQQSPSTSAGPSHSSQRRAGEPSWHPVWRGLVTLLVVLHLTAVFSAPWALSTQPALPPGYVPPPSQESPLPPPDSPMWQEPRLPRLLHGFFRHYLNLLYLNHGYEFFAPDPNGSHLIRYQVYDSGGAEIASGEFPSLEEQWPRLLYHRHMMLAAQTGDLGEESGRHFARHLLHLHGGHTCQLQWVIHKLLSPDEVRQGTPLDDPSTFEVLARIEETVNVEPSANEQAVRIPGAGR